MPISVLHKPPLHPAITFSKDWFKSAVPTPAHDFELRAAGERARWADLERAAGKAAEEVS